MKIFIGLMQSVGIALWVVGLMSVVILKAYFMLIKSYIS